MNVAKMVVKVLKYTKIASAKLKIFRKISTKNGKNSTIFYSKVRNTNCKRSLLDHVVHVTSFNHASSKWTRIYRAVVRNKK